MQFLDGNRGFSLVELMIVLALLSIVAGIAVPSFSTLIENNRVQSASEELYNSLQYTRSEALVRKTSITIEAINGSDWAKGFVIKEGTTTLRQHEGFTHPNLTANSAQNSLTFFPNGTLSPATPVEISMCFDGKKDKGRLLKIMASGRVSLQPANEHPDSCS